MSIQPTTSDRFVILMWRKAFKDELKRLLAIAGIKRRDIIPLNRRCDCPEYFGGSYQDEQRKKDFFNYGPFLFVLADASGNGEVRAEWIVQFSRQPPYLRTLSFQRKRAI